MQSLCIFLKGRGLAKVPVASRASGMWRDPVTEMPQIALRVIMGGVGQEKKSWFCEPTVTRSRLATYDKNICPQCSAWLLAPEWSEYLNHRCVRHTWACHACSYASRLRFFSRRWKEPPPDKQRILQKGFGQSAPWRISVPPPAEIFYFAAVRAQIIAGRSAICRGRPECRAHRSAGTGRKAAAQRAHQRLALGDAGAQMRRAGREIGVVQVIGLDPALDQRSHQRAEPRRRR